MPSVAVSGSLPTAEELASFRAAVLARGRELYRDLPWRRTRDPYAIWISEVMLQQTQVSRVDGRWQRWRGLFPTVDALASADSADVLGEWQGLGYNRRALSLWRAAQEVSAAGGQMPSDEAALKAILKKYVRWYNVRTESVHNDGVNLIIEVRRVKDSGALIKELKATDAFHDVSLLIQEGAVD